MQEVTKIFCLYSSNNKSNTKNKYKKTSHLNHIDEREIRKLFFFFPPHFCVLLLGILEIK